MTNPVSSSTFYVSALHKQIFFADQNSVKKTETHKVDQIQLLQIVFYKEWSDIIDSSPRPAFCVCLYFWYLQKIIQNTATYTDAP